MSSSLALSPHKNIMELIDSISSWLWLMNMELTDSNDSINYFLFLLFLHYLIIYSNLLVSSCMQSYLLAYIIVSRELGHTFQMIKLFNFSLRINSKCTPSLKQHRKGTSLVKFDEDSTHVLTLLKQRTKMKSMHN